MFKRSVLLCLTVLTFTASVRAQSVDLRGVVTDSTTGERIANANVVIRELGKGASTNVNGFYIITNVPVGTYSLVVSAVGYGRDTVRIELRSGNPMVMDVRLSQKPVELSEVVVESDRISKQAGATTKHVLGSREMQEIPTAGQSDVLRSLQILPGIVSTADVSSKFYVRGGAGDQNLILLDGMRIYNPFHAFGTFSVFDPDIISAAEIYTGAFPAGFGNRLSSVVNLTTRQGNTTRFAGRSELNFLDGKLELEGPIAGGNSWIVNARKSLFDGGLNHFVGNPAPTSFYDVFFKGTLGSQTGRTSFRGFLSGDNVTSGNADTPDFSWRSRSFALSIAGLAYDRVYIDLVAYTSGFSVSRDAKRSLVVHPASSNVDDDGMRMEFTIHTDSRDIYIAGFQFDIPNFDYTYTTSSNVERQYSDNDTELWLWFRHRKEWGSLETDMGVQIDAATLLDNGASWTAFQPRLGVRYKLSELWGIRASYGLFNQRVITISNEDDITSLFEAWIKVPPELNSEEAHHLVLGLDGILSRRVTLGIQGYYKRYTRLVLYNRNKLFPGDPDFINGTGRAYGSELLTRFSSSLLDLYFSYTLGWTNVSNEGITYSPRYDRRHTVNALGIVHPVRDLDIALRWEFGSGYPFTQTAGYYDRLSLANIGEGELYGETGSPYSILGEKNAARLPGYYRIDAGITYHFMVNPFKGSVGLDVSNLTNRKNILFYDRKTGQEITMLDFFPSATLKLEF